MRGVGGIGRPPRSRAVRLRPQNPLASLAILRLECAAILARELALELPAAELVPTLLDSLHFSAYPEVPGTPARWRERGLCAMLLRNFRLCL